MARVVIISVLLSFLQFACSKDNEGGPGKIRWDREVCERCAMTIGDHSFAAQIRGGEPDQPARLYKFDDIGCAVIWLDQQSWKDEAYVGMWVSEESSGEWIDAQMAWYVKANNTPMDYGLGAQIVKTPESFDFEQARKLIFDKEKHLNIHHGLPHTTPLSTELPVVQP